jgi:hypothetical protein
MSLVVKVDGVRGREIEAAPCAWICVDADHRRDVALVGHAK